MESRKDYDDPEPGNEDDPEYQDEMFRTFRHMGWKPEDLMDPKYASKYAEWLKTAPPDEE